MLCRLFFSVPRALASTGTAPPCPLPAMPEPPLRRTREAIRQFTNQSEGVHPAKQTRGHPGSIDATAQDIRLRRGRCGSQLLRHRMTREEQEATFLPSEHIFIQKQFSTVPSSVPLYKDGLTEMDKWRQCQM